MQELSRSPGPADIPIFVEPEGQAVALIEVSLVEPPSGALLASPPGGLPWQRPRLARGALLPLGGRPALCQLIGRVRRARLVTRVVAALSVAPDDDLLARLAREAGAEVFRGSVHDLVGRLAGCVEWLELSGGQPVVRVGVESPFLDPRYLDAGLCALLRTGAGAVEFTEDQTEELCPGLSAGFLRADTIKLIDRRARTAAQRADVMGYVYQYPDEVGLLRVPLPEDLAYLLGTHRLLLQTAEDLALHEAIYLRLYQGGPVDTADVVAFLDADPVMACLNRGVLQWASSPVPAGEAAPRARGAAGPGAAGAAWRAR